MGIANPMVRFADRMMRSGNPRTGFANPRARFWNRKPGFWNPRAGFADPKARFADPIVFTAGPIRRYDDLVYNSLNEAARRARPRDPGADRAVRAGVLTAKPFLGHTFARSRHYRD